MTSLLPDSTADITRADTSATAGSTVARALATISTWADWKDEPAKVSGSSGILTPDHIECDWPAVMNIRDWKPEAKPFVHVPTITLTRGDDTTVITGPVEPVLPRMTDASLRAWHRWLEDLAAHNAESQAAAAAANRKVKEYFEKRLAKQEADREAKYKRACDRAFRQGKSAPPRPVRKTPPDNWTMFIKDEVLRAMMRAASGMRDNAKRRRRYVHKRGPVAGRDTDNFVEEFEHADGTPAPALRTALNTISLHLFNSALPKSLVYGYDKTKVYNASITGIDPMTARDMVYIESDRCRRSLFVVNLDGWFSSIRALRRALRKLLPPELMPNIIVYRASVEKGGIENPHLLWLLPPGARVCYEKGKDKSKQYTLHHMVQKGIVNHLIPLGADPDHHNVWKFKCPLSPKWSIDVCDDSFATMDEWRSFLPTITPDVREMRRRAKLVKAARLGVDPDEVELSAAIWNDGVVSRRLMIRSAQATKDPAFIRATNTSHAAFVDWLYHPATGVVARRLIRLHGDTTAVRSVLRAQRELVEELKLTPDQAGNFADRGRDYFINRYKKQELGPNASAEDRKYQEIARKATAGRRSRAAAKDLSCGLIAEEIERCIAAGVEVVKAEIVKALVKSGTVSRSVAYAHFDHVLEVVLEAARYQEVCSDRQYSSSDDRGDETAEDIQISDVGSVRCFIGEQSDVVIVFKPSDSGQTTNQKIHRVSEYELTRLYRAYATRESWREAVSSWRKKHQFVQSVGDLADLDDDDQIIRAAMLMGSGWSQSSRTLH